uniref:Uncharacterized protein n=1 Tax=Bracon brevicornis TaxID=1563983 RepID=A0A6V7KRS6_9HYME
MVATCKHIFHAACLATKFNLPPELTAAAIPKICPSCSTIELSENLPQAVIDRLACLEFPCVTLSHEFKSLTGTVQKLSESFKSISMNFPPITEFTLKQDSTTKKIQGDLSEVLYSERSGEWVGTQL